MAVPSFPDGVLTELSHALADGEGLTGTEITNILRSCGIADGSGESTKWKRLYYTFDARQREDKCASAFGAFIESALEPARWGSKPQGLYRDVRARVNTALSLIGLTVSDAGKLTPVAAAHTLDQAHERAHRLRARLMQREVHPEVLRHCRALLLKDSNYFHSVFETVKGIAERVREMTGLETDGNVLVQQAFEELTAHGYPRLAFNAYRTTTEKNEHRGLTSLFRGLVFAFRNTLAHEPAEIWPVSEDDALDTMNLASLLHRRLDKAYSTVPRASCANEA